MNKILHSILLLLNIIIAIASVFWFARDMDYEPFISVILSIAGLIALYFTNPAKQISQSIKAGSKSTNVQAGENLTITKNLQNDNR